MAAMEPIAAAAPPSGATGGAGAAGAAETDEEDPEWQAVQPSRWKAVKPKVAVTVAFKEELDDAHQGLEHRQRE